MTEAANASSNLTDLISRLERASGPDRELDAEMFCACYPEYTVGRSSFGSPLVIKGGFRHALGDHERYTASLDSALVLVEAARPDLCVENLGFIADSGALQGEWLAQLRPRRPRPRMAGPITPENVRSVLDGLTPETAKTPALALCLALLRSLEAAA